MKHKAKRSLLSILLTLALVCGLMPGMSLTAYAAPVSYPLWVGGVQVTSANADDVFGDRKVSYDAAGNTLNLSGYSNDGAYYTEAEAGVYDSENRITAGIYYSGTDMLTVKLEGNNTLTMPALSEDKLDNAAIFSIREVTFTGNGSLTAVGGSAAKSYGFYGKRKGIAVNGGSLELRGGEATKESCGFSGEWGGVTVSGGALTAIGGAVTGAGGLSCGIENSLYSVEVENGTLTAVGGAVSGANGQSIGLHSILGPVYFEEGAQATCESGNVTGDKGTSYGIRCAGLNVAGGSVSAMGAAAEDSCGVYNDISIHIEGGKLTATGGTATRSRGIYSGSLGIEVTGGELSAAGGTADDSCGIYLVAVEASDGTTAEANLTISDGEVTANGGSYGVFCDTKAENKMIVITGGTATATGNTASLSKAPILGADVAASGSASIDGGSPVDYDEENNDSYKWFKTVGNADPKTPVTAVAFTVDEPVAGAEPAEKVQITSFPEGGLSIAEYDAVWLESEDDVTFVAMTSPIFEAGKYYAVEEPNEKNAGAPLIALAASGYALSQDVTYTVNGEESDIFLGYMGFFGPLEEVSYGVGVSPAVLSFAAREGYSEEDRELHYDITAYNTEEGEISFIAAGFKESSMYEQFGLIVGGMTATVYPKAGLTEGTYNATVRITDWYDRFDDVEVPVTFTVKETGDAPVPAVIPNSISAAVEATGYLEINAVEGQEYALALEDDAPDWTSPIEQADGKIVLTGMEGGARYNLYTRIAATQDMPVSSAVATPFVTSVSSYGWTADADPELIGATVNADFDSIAELSYQWYQCDDEEGTNETEISGATDMEFVVPAELEGKYFFSKVFIDGIEVGSFYPHGPVSYGAVNFDSKGGSAVDILTGLTAGTVLTKPEPTRAGWYLEGWYLDEEYKEAWSFDSDVARSVELTLYAKWSSVPTQIAEGIVYASDGTTPVPGISVRLTRADANFGSTKTDADGKFSFTAVPGMYNIIAYDETSDLTKTELAELAAGQNLTVIMPEAGRNSVLANWNAGDYAATVGGLDDIAAGEVVGAGESVTIMLSVTAGDQVEYSGLSDTEKAEFETGKAAIGALSENNGKTVEYICLTLEKMVSDGNTYTTTDIGDNNTRLLTIIIPFDVSGKTSIAVYRYHGTQAVAMKRDPAAGEEGFKVGNGSITIYAKAFSAYGIVYGVNSGGDSSGGGSSSGGTSGETSGSNAAGNTFFVDVPADSYYYDAVKWAVDNGITEGTSETAFSPQDICTRAQMVTFIWRAAGKPEPAAADIPFTDLDRNGYYYKAVLWAYEDGITLGTGETTFSPDDTVSRSQSVVFLFRALNGVAGLMNPFEDVSDSAYYLDAVKWAYENGITNGTGDTTFSPDDDCLRGQIVTFLYRSYKDK